MKLVVAVDKNWAIGNKGQLLVHIPEDMKHFKSLTEGHVVILGRRTLATFPGGRPLKNRFNIVLTKKGLDSQPDMAAAGSVEEALELAEKHSIEHNTEDIFVIGGSSVYKQFLPYADTAYVTYVDYSYEADSYFPDLDRSEEWVMTETSDEKTYFDVEYYFRIYKRIRNAN